MALTRGAHQPPRIPPGGVAHMDDGELLDKEGKPISTVGHHVAQAPPAPPENGLQGDDQRPRLDPSVMAEPPPPAPVAPAGPPVWRCDPSTMARDASGWELAQVLSIFLGRPFVIDLPDDEARALPADARRHFRRIA